MPKNNLAGWKLNNKKEKDNIRTNKFIWKYESVRNITIDSIDIACNSLSLLQSGNVVDILTLIGQGGVDIPTLITSLLNDTTFMNAISQSNTGYTTAQADALFYSQTFLNTQLNSKLNASVINSI